MTPEAIKQFMLEQTICVLSTIHADGRPQSAVVGFAVHDNFELTIGTSNKTRKYQNLLVNPAVAVVIGWDNLITVQYEGLARQLEGDELAKYQALHFEQRPATAKYRDLPTERLFLIKPTWLRYADYRTKDGPLKELTFSDAEHLTLQ